MDRRIATLAAAAVFAAGIAIAPSASAGGNVAVSIGLPGFSVGYSNNGYGFVAAAPTPYYAAPYYAAPYYAAPYYSAPYYAAPYYNYAPGYSYGGYGPYDGYGYGAPGVSLGFGFGGFGLGFGGGSWGHHRGRW